MTRQSLFLILVIILLTGCAPKNDWTLTKSDLNILKTPEIDNGSIAYYFEEWGPSGTVIKVHYNEDKILFLESKYIENIDPYMPMLIESLKNEGPTAIVALRFITHIFRQQYPHGYYYHIYNPHPTRTDCDAIYADTPFEKYSPIWTETTYSEWKKWWDKEGKKRQSP
ncbi:hypothetical protein C6499_19295 [Candidatus Poribacteria bacterium]|nr:MAG: hypothetical protein C6499_19295 [Candidatus Poribacteria bacterium]